MSRKRHQCPTHDQDFLGSLPLLFCHAEISHEEGERLILRLHVYTNCMALIFVVQNPGFDFSGADISGNYRGGGPKF